MKNKFKSQIYILTAFFAIAIFSCSSNKSDEQQNAKENIIAEEEDYRRILTTACTAYNDSLPKTLNDGTIMKSCKLYGYSILYVIEVQELSKEELQAKKEALFQDIVEMLAISFDVNRQTIKLMRNEGYDFAFKYVDPNGRFLMKINISPKNILEVLDDDI